MLVASPMATERLSFKQSENSAADGLCEDCVLYTPEEIEDLPSLSVEQPKPKELKI
jgi:hypothetical protein